MSKISVFFFCILLCCACHARRDVSPSSAASSENTAVQTPVLTSSASPSAAPQTDTAAITKPAVPAKPQLSASPSMQESTAAQPTEVSAPALLETAVLSPAQAPVQDQAVFKDEPLISLDGRMLHPYADLTADSSAVQNAPWAYEQLKYGIYYTFIKAGTAYIRNRGIVSVNGTPAYLLQTTAFSATVIDSVFKVRDINHSWLATDGSYSLGYGQSVREGSYKRDEWAVFDYENAQYNGQIQKKEAPRQIKGPLTGHTLDMLTSLYYVRTQKLEPGQDIILDIVNREKQYPLIVKVLKKETVKTAAGKFDCVLVEPQIRGEGIFVSKGKSLKVWLTDDEYKMPVKMKVDVFIGSVSAELLEYRRQAGANIL